MKIVTDFVKPAAASKYDADAAELIEASKTNPNVIGAITVNVLNAVTDEDAAKLIASETRAFQAAALKAGYSARVQTVRNVGEGDNEVLFSIGPKAERKTGKTEAVEATAETVTETVTETETAKPGAKSHK